MSLSDKQWIFLQNVGNLITYAAKNGYKLTGGELYRTEDQQWLYYNGKTIHDGELIDDTRKSKTMKSKHLKRLAVDLNIFKNGVLTYKYEDVEPLGRYWMSLNKNNRWGGDWNKNHENDDNFKDIPHFEMNI